MNDKYLTIEYLRFICIGAVVLLHAVGAPVEGRDIISWRYGIYDIIRIFFSEGICRVAVPTLFLISGFLFFTRLEKWSADIWANKLKRRAKTLILPYFIWNLLSIVFSLLMLYLIFALRGGGRSDHGYVV